MTKLCLIYLEGIRSLINKFNAQNPIIYLSSISFNFVYHKHEIIFSQSKKKPGYKTDKNLILI